MTLIVERTVYVLAVMVLASLFWLIAVSIHADGRTDFCYIEAVDPGSYTPPLYRLMQHRPYRSDLIAGVFTTTSEAVDLAQKMGCPLR